MLKTSCFILFIISSLYGFGQTKSMADIKSDLEKSPNSPLYVKDIMKKKFRLDTIIVTNTTHFHSLSDSLAYKGVVKKVYGPYNMGGQRFLVQVLEHLPNTFYRISQIFIDTSVFRYRTADSLGNAILYKLKNKQESFERLSQAYSMGGESNTSGDLGWVARGSMIPSIEKLLEKAKKGDVFSIWSKQGLHIIKLVDGPRQDTGVALMMRIFL